MILQIEQRNRELYEAEFSIRRGNDVTGAIHIKGTPGHMEADARMEIFDKTYLLSPDDSVQLLNGGGQRRSREEKVYRTYLINGKGGGSICQVERKTGVFSSVVFREMIFENEVITMYAKTFKTEGKNSVYCRNQQIAQIDTSSKIVDGMYRYTVYAVDEKAAVMAALYCIYMYILTGFKPGEKVVKGTYTQTSVSFDKTFDEKYNPDFIRNIKI